MNVQEMAAKTAAEIRRRGWTRGRNFDPETGSPQDCKVCLRGAAIAATRPVKGYRDLAGWPPAVTPLLEAVAERLSLFNKWSPSSAMTWNDQPGRTVEEVLAVLDRVAAA